MSLQNTPKIITQRLVLRKFEEGDAEMMLQLYSDVEVNTFLPWFPLNTKQDVKRYLQDVIMPCYNQKASYTYAIILKENGELIGYVHLHDIGGENDLGYGLSKQYWRKGIMSEACRAVVCQLRADGLPFITATHDINNPHSGYVMQSLGMQYERSYQEMWQPKNIPVTFKKYRLVLNL